MASHDPDYVAAALDQLFALPLDFQPDIDDVLASVDSSAARLYLVDRLERDYLRGDSAVFQEIFARIGCDEVSNDIERIVQDKTLAPGARACALEIVCGDDRKRHARLLGTLEPDDRRRLIDEPLRELVADAIENADAGIAIAFVAEHFPESRHLPLEQHLELVRRQMGATAATVYQPLLCSRKLVSTHEAMVEALVREAAPDAAAALECALEEAPDAETRGRFQKALKDLRDRPPAPPIEAVGRLGPIDGPGRFEAALIVANPDGTKTLAFLLLHEDEILDGFVDYDPPEDLLSSDHLPAVEVSAGAVAAVTARAIAAVERDELDPMTLAAVRFFQRLPEPEPLEEPQPAGEPVDEEFVADLMRRPEYLLWAFAPEDFHQCGVPEPPENPDDEWLSMALACLDTKEMRDCVRRDVAHMARWHLARGEGDVASRLARAGSDLEHQFASHPLVRAMVGRSIRILHHPDIPDRPIDDDPIDLAEIHDPERINRDLLIAIIDRQIETSDPAAASEVFERLKETGRSDHEARLLMAEVLEKDLETVIESEEPHDREAYAAALRRLID